MKAIKKLTLILALLSLTSCNNINSSVIDNNSTTNEISTENANSTNGETIHLTYAVATKPSAEEKAVIEKFNEADNGYEITIKDYSEYYDSPNAEWFQVSDEQRKNLNITVTQDIINGRIDIIRDQYLVPASTMDNLASKGGLVDLYAFMDNDNDVNKTTLNSHILEIHETDDKLYFLPTFYYITTLVGQTKYVGENEYWNIDGLIEQWSKMPEGSTINGYRQKDYVYMTLLQSALDQFIDNADGKAHFDSPEFRKSLEFCNTFDPPLTYYNEGEGQGSNFVSDIIISGFREFHTDVIENENNEPVTLIGYPSENGSGAFVNAECNRFAICASIPEERQQGAWEFIKMFAMDEYQTANAYSTQKIRENGSERIILSSSRGFPINLNVYNKLAHDVIDGTADFGGFDESASEAKSLTEDEFIRLTDYINSIQKVSISIDNDLWTMIREEVMSYFNGEKDIDETVEIIQNRAEIIVSEKQ